MLALRGVMPFVAKDPGLLTAKLFPLEKTLKYPMCIIPHFKDKPQIISALSKNRSVIKIISIFVPLKSKGHVIDVAKNLVLCEKIVSTSLRGLIVSHSYGIPAAVITVSGKRFGGNYKFRDYYESLSIFMEREKIRHEVEDIMLLNHLTYLSDLVEKTPQPQ